MSKLLAATTMKPQFATTLCCPYIPSPSDNAELRTKLLAAFMPCNIKVAKNIDADPGDLDIYDKILIGLFSPVWFAPFTIFCLFSSIKNKILYNDWKPFKSTKQMK